MQVQVYPIPADPWRSRCCWPGHPEPLEKTGLLKKGLGRGFVLVEAFWAFLKNKKGIYSFPEPRSGLGASRLCAGCSGGTSWLGVSPPSFPAGTAPTGSGRAARAAGEPREMGARFNPEHVIEHFVEKPQCKKGFLLL